jgi:hypothetical protein
MAVRGLVQVAEDKCRPTRRPAATCKVEPTPTVVADSADGPREASGARSPISRLGVAV